MMDQPIEVDIFGFILAEEFPIVWCFGAAMFMWDYSLCSTQFPSLFTHYSLIKSNQSHTNLPSIISLESKLINSWKNMFTSHCLGWNRGLKCDLVFSLLYVCMGICYLSSLHFKVLKSSCYVAGMRCNYFWVSYWNFSSMVFF